MLGGCTSSPTEGALDRATEKRIDTLIAGMTLDEKIGQLNQVSTAWSAEAMADDIRSGRMGSILNEVNPATVNAMQRIVVEKSRFDKNPSNIPGSAEYTEGDQMRTIADLEIGTEYYVVAAAELLGYTVKEPLVTLGSGGTSDPAGHPDDFWIADIPVKQARSARRGISGGFQMDTDAALLGPGVSWCYNWSHNYPDYTPRLDEAGMLFLPMVWNAGINEAQILRYAEEHPQAQYLLAYNEPNLTDQANMTPAQAAAAWPALKAVAQKAGLKLISPALNYGTLAGYSDPEKWMDDFLACDGVSLDDMAGIALHCYMPNVPGMRAMIRKFDKYRKPIFMTEFCHANGTITNDVATQKSFMSEVLNFLETDSAVGGYSWFMCRASGSWGAISLLGSDTARPALTELGEMYVHFSSFDKNCWYRPGEPIPAEHYSAHNCSDAAPSESWTPPFPVLNTTDRSGDLMVVGNKSGAWVEYQIEVDAARTYALAVRYQAELMDGTFDLSIDGGTPVEAVFEKTDYWKTKWIDLDLSAGRHTLRLAHRNGRADFNYLYLD